MKEYKHFTKEALEEIVRLSTERGVSERKISEELGYSPNNINLYKHKFGVASKPKNYRYTKTKEEIEAIIAYAKENKLPTYKVAEERGIKRSMFVKYKKLYGLGFIKHNPMNKTKEEIEAILQYSLDNDVPEHVAAEIHGIPKFTLWMYKNKYGIEKTDPHSSRFKSHECKWKVPVNDDFFAVPNMTNCYYAGFIAADGCLSLSNNSLSIHINTKDIDLLKRLMKDMDFNGNINFHSKRPMCSLVWTSKKQHEDLEKNFNITPRKTYTLQPPNLTDEKLIDAFILGLLDGDGCVSIFKRKNTKWQDGLAVSVIGTHAICEFVKKRFDEILGSPTKKNVCDSKKHRFSTYSVSDAAARKIFEHYYAIDIPKFERKWSQKVHEYCVNFTNRPSSRPIKKVYLYDIDGNYIKMFSSAKEAAEELGIGTGSVTYAARLDDGHHIVLNKYMLSYKKKQMQKFVRVGWWNKDKINNAGD